MKKNEQYTKKITLLNYKYRWVYTIGSHFFQNIYKIRDTGSPKTRIIHLSTIFNYFNIHNE